MSYKFNPFTGNFDDAGDGASGFVPYTGATGDVDLGGNNLAATSGSLEDLLVDNGGGQTTFLAANRTSFYNVTEMVHIYGGTEDIFEIQQGVSSSNASRLDVGELTATRTHTLPDHDGTFGMIEYQAGAPVGGNVGTLYINTSAPTDVYYFESGNRYKLTAVLDNPAAATGSPIGLLLALTYA